MHLKYWGLVFIVILFLFLVSCSQTTSPELTPSKIQPSEASSVQNFEAYPQLEAQQTISPLQAYPSPSSIPGSEIHSDSYPAPESGQIEAGGPPFELQKPIIAGSDTIMGTGPAGVPIAIVDVTLMGDVLGQGIIDSSGKFSIKIIPIEKSHRIGIILGNLEGTQWQPENFYLDGFLGDNALQIPLVGFMFDTALVRGD
jgi:hypothetical protein